VVDTQKNPRRGVLLDVSQAGARPQHVRTLVEGGRAGHVEERGTCSRRSAREVARSRRLKRRSITIDGIARSRP
jgi:hypothetical protein